MLFFSKKNKHASCCFFSISQAAQRPLLIRCVFRQRRWLLCTVQQSPSASLDLTGLCEDLVQGRHVGCDWVRHRYHYITLAHY